MEYYSSSRLLIFFYCSGPREIRTLDLLNAIETRSQLRYGPGCFTQVDLEGVEPSTSSVRLKRAPTALQARSLGQENSTQETPVCQDK